MTIYIGGRISGTTYDECVEYFNQTKDELEFAGFKVLSPMTAKAALRVNYKDRELPTSGYTEPTSTNHAIFERDQWCVRQCDIFYLNLMATQVDQHVSIGGIMELAWAALLGKHTVVSLPADNIHRHAFVLEGADIIYPTHEEAMEYLKKLPYQVG